VLLHDRSSFSLVDLFFPPVCGTIAGLASFEGKRGVVCRVFLREKKRMGPLDLVAYLYPEAGPKSGVSESPKKPDAQRDLKIG
jgi:hypothetical protein